MKYFLCRTLRYWFLAFVSISPSPLLIILSNWGLVYHISVTFHMTEPVTLRLHLTRAFDKQMILYYYILDFLVYTYTMNVTEVIFSLPPIRGGASGAIFVKQKE